MSKNKTLPPPEADPIELELKKSSSLPPVPADCYPAVAKHAAEPLGSKSELAKSAAFEAEWKLCHKVVLAHIPAAAKGAYYAAQSTMGDRIAAGQPCETDAWAEKDWAEDYAERMQAAKNKAESISRAARVIARPVVMKYILLAHELADAIEAKDKAALAEFGITDYEPSLLVRTIRASAFHAANHVAGIPNWSSAPSHSLQFLNL